MVQNFEQQKNMKAAGYTAGIVLLLLLLLFYVKWYTPTMPLPPIEDGIEVNLGSSDMGLGDDQPFEPGEPAPQNQQAYVPAKANTTENNDLKDVMTDEEDAEAPAVAKPPIVRPDASKVTDKKVVKAPVKKAAPTVTPTPAPPKPKAVFKGATGTGTGGNDADSYKKGGSEGVAGGTGDQGRPGGDPNSKNYEGGGSGNGNIAVTKGNRKIVSGLNFSFTGEFDRDAAIYADIKVNAAGIGEFLRVSKGSTSMDRKYVDNIIQKLKDIRFEKASGESLITVKFNFKVTR